MKRYVRLVIPLILILAALLMPSIAAADTPIGGTGPDDRVMDAQWQKHAFYYAWDELTLIDSAEYWSYYVTGTVSNTIGCSQDFPTYCSETYDMYYGHTILDNQAYRAYYWNDPLAWWTQDYYDIYSDMDTWFDYETVTMIEQFQQSYRLGSGVVRGTDFFKLDDDGQDDWPPNEAGDNYPDNRAIDIDNTWDYWAFQDPNSGIYDFETDCMDNDRLYEVTVTGPMSFGPAQHQTSGTENRHLDEICGQFQAYQVRYDYTDTDLSLYMGNCYESGWEFEYWDEDGALVSPIYCVDHANYAHGMGGEPDCDLDWEYSPLLYHDWGGDPIVYSANASGSETTSFTTSDTIYVYGADLTLGNAASPGGPSGGSDPNDDNVYNVYYKQTGSIPTAGTSLATWTSAGTVSVAPDNGNNVPGTLYGSNNVFAIGTLSAGTYCIVIDDGDGTYQGDTTDQCTGYDTCQTGYDDGVSGLFTVGTAPLPIVDIYVNLQGENRPASGWEIPIDVGFFPSNSGTLVLSGSSGALYWFEGTTSGTVTMSGTRAYFQCPSPVSPGTYDITVDSETTLMNVKREVNIP